MEPGYDTLSKLAETFDVSVDYLLGRTDSRKNPEDDIRQALSDEPELLDFFNEMTKRDDLQMFAKQCSKLKPSTIKKLMEISKMFEEEERKRHGG